MIRKVIRSHRSRTDHLIQLKDTNKASRFIALLGGTTHRKAQTMAHQRRKMFNAMIRAYSLLDEYERLWKRLPSSRSTDFHTTEHNMLVRQYNQERHRWWFPWPPFKYLPIHNRLAAQRLNSAAVRPLQ